MKSKFVLLLLMFFVTVAAVNAQDIITKTDDSSMVAKVVEITPTTVKYKKIDNPEGPVYNIPVAEIKAITYQNGKVEKFNVVHDDSTIHQVAPTNASDEQLLQSYQNLNNEARQSQSVSDQKLLALGKYQDLDWSKHENKARKLRLIGLAGGSILIAGGVVSLILDEGYQEGFFIGGLAAMGTGVILGTSMLIAANHQSKKANEIKRAALSAYTIFQDDYSKLTAGIDMIYYHNTPSLGVGLRLAF